MEPSEMARRLQLRTLPLASIGAVLFLAVVLGVFFRTGLTSMVEDWSREEYSYGYLVPFIAVFLLSRRLPEALAALPGARWPSPVLAALAVGLGLLGAFSNISDLSQYGFFLALAAAAVAHLGTRGALRIWTALVYLLFMIPLPQVVYLKLTAGMQLVSSEIGVWFIRLMDVPVFLGGNIIDLGIYKLQVAEACSGLRYMFPLMSFGFLFAALYRGPNWQRIILFLSTIPITILMNGLRIGVIGVLVDSYGIEQAEGFLHFFEGWVIFGVCVFVLFLECLLLMRLGGSKLPLRDALDLRFDGLGPLLRLVEPRGKAWPFAAATGALALGAVLVLLDPIHHADGTAPRRAFATFPTQIAGWSGRPRGIDPEIQEVLGADDAIVLDYVSGAESAPVNLFMSYYSTQTQGEATHSPEVCIPGDGWEIRSLKTRPVTVGGSGGKTVSLYRAVIQKGVYEALVYFWFEQRGRQLTNEYVVKWYILRDALTRNRTDGGLVRLVTPIVKTEDDAQADKRLEKFLALIYDDLPKYLPY